MNYKEQVLRFFDIKEERDSKDLNSRLYRFAHRATGARVAVISNDDENKAFFIGFRTPPVDSTGVPHILEHSVLCGSKNFPVKDPFILLAKGSLNTYLNAVTFPDRTLYPVASCNDKDFQNLMHVYLDAVFYPNIYREEHIFRQEGWHYELEDLDAPLTINGVVYNEMKGAMSDADELHDMEVFNSLYPDTCYSLNSGGDPAVIPKLTYEEFLDFHSSLYHPTNSFIYLYGNMDVWEKLWFIHEEYLQHFDKRENVDTRITPQEPFRAPIEVCKPYPVLEDEDTSGKAYLSYNVSVGNCLDAELCLALEILDYALCSAPGAPVKEALRNAGIGKDVYSDYEQDVFQPFFSIVAKDADRSEKDTFKEVIEKELSRIVKEGFDPKAIRAALHYSEFRYREAEHGRYPKGIILGLDAMNGWNYSDDAPFLHLELDHAYQSLKQKAEKGYFEALVEKYLLQNNHKSIVVMYPEPGLATRKEQELATALAERKASMSREELENIIRIKESLDLYQDTPDSAESLNCIPLLTRQDLKREIQPYVNDLKQVQGIKVLTHPVYTKGIAYTRLIFDMSRVPQDLFPYIALLGSCIGMVSTTKHKYGDLFNELNLVSGGMTAVNNIYTHAEDLSRITTTFEIKCKMLYEDMKDATALLDEIVFESVFTDSKRMAEIVETVKSRLQSHMSGSGHTVAAMRAMSYFSKAAAISEGMNGLSLYRFYDELDRSFEERKEEIAEKLSELCRILFRRENFMADITAEEAGITGWLEFVPRFADKLYTCPVRTGSFEPQVVKRNEGFMTSGQVQYVCRAGNFLKRGYRYHGALKVLKVIMGYEYLWNQVRVKGGAYGCMCSFGKSGDSYFVSYRDPNLERTIDVYERAADAIAAFDADERTMTQYVIGAISDMDTPMSPATIGIYSLGGYMTGRTEEDIRKDRLEVLDCQPEDIRALAGHVRAVMDEKALCVVGGADRINAAGDVFDEIKQLF